MTEIVRHGRNGWLVEPGDVTALVDAIGALRADPALAQRLAEQTPADAQTEFSVEQYLRRMTQAIRQAARQCNSTRHVDASSAFDVRASRWARARARR
ncbi:glycosyltransferase [Paraburkholderia sediminicola]|uniref:glycosyltransferase n=1 Tax=Paraburkholderia sediminicola TaxID=458836 RepID=UPI0038B708C8